MRSFLAALALAVLAPTGLAQGAADVGLTVLLPNQRFGAICQPVTCQPLNATVSSGLSFGVSAYGVLGSSYAVLAAPAAGGCTTFPGIHHALALGPGVVVLGAGVIGSPLVGLCVGGSDSFMLTVPPGFAGARFALQAIAMSPVGLSFTSALAVTVL
jgi:hypothetical protein